MHLAIQSNNNLNILEVVIMMRMTFASFMQFFFKLTGACYEAFVAVVEEKGCHGGETEMVPRQHIGSDSSRRYRCKRKCGVSVSCKMVGDPGYRVPTVRWYGNEEEHGMTTRKRCNHEHLIQHTCIRSRASSQGYTF